MHVGEVFEASTSFPTGKLPMKRQVIERMLNFSDHRTPGAAISVGRAVHKR